MPRDEEDLRGFLSEGHSEHVPAEASTYRKEGTHEVVRWCAIVGVGRHRDSFNSQGRNDSNHQSGVQEPRTEYLTSLGAAKQVELET